VDDLHDHLAGGHRLDDLGADGAVTHLVGERAHDLERDIRLEQGAAHLAHRLLDIGFAQRAAALEAVEDAGQSCRQAFEHDRSNQHFRGTPKMVPGTADRNAFRARGRILRCRAGASGVWPRSAGWVSDEREWGGDRAAGAESQGKRYS